MSGEFGEWESLSHTIMFTQTAEQECSLSVSTPLPEQRHALFTAQEIATGMSDNRVCDCFPFFCLLSLNVLWPDLFSPKQQTVCLNFVFSALFLGWPFDCTVYNEGLLCLCKKNVSILPLWLYYLVTRPLM